MLNRHVIAVLLGATLISSAPIFAVLSHEWGHISPTASAMWRVLLAAPIFIAASCLQRRSSGASPAPPTALRPFWFLLPGLVFAADLSSWHTSMTMISAGLATLLANLAAVLVPIAAWFLFRERPSGRFVVGAGLALFGTVLLLQPPSASIVATLPGREDQYLSGTGLGLMTAVWYGGYQLSVKRLRQRASTAHTMAWVTGIAGPCLLLVTMVAGGRIWPTDPKAWLAIFGMVLFSQVAGQGLIAWSLGKVPAAMVAVTLLWQPLAATVLGYFALGQQLSVLQMVAMVPVFLGLFLVASQRPEAFARRLPEPVPLATD